MLCKIKLNKKDNYKFKTNNCYRMKNYGKIKKKILLMSKKYMIYKTNHRLNKSNCKNKKKKDKFIIN